jgi:hypothetical protein
MPPCKALKHDQPARLPQIRRSEKKNATLEAAIDDFLGKIRRAVR